MTFATFATGALRAELFATRKRPGAWLLGGVWVLMAILFGTVVPYVVYLATRGTPTGGRSAETLLTGVLPAEFLAGTVGLYPMFGGAMMLIAGAVLAGGDYRWGTLGTVLTQNPSRVVVVTARAAAIAAGLLTISVATVLATGAAGTVVALLAGRATAWPGVPTLLAGVGATWLISMAAASLGMFLATLFRNTAAAVGAGLVWLLAVENLVSALAGTIAPLHGVQQALLGPSGGSLASALGSATQADGGVPGVVKVSGPGTACAVLAIYVVLFVALSATVTSRRDAR